jgi:cephalosporin-C deacetylase-like acetyl esterase
MLIVILITLGVSSSHAQYVSNTLPWRNTTAYNSYLMREVHRQYADRQTELAKALQSKNEMQQHQELLRDRFRKIMGELPPKYPLKSRVLKSTPQKGFIVEKIIFESLPKRYVTANLYLPVGEGPFPASLELCGHGTGGKIGAPAEAILLAKNGIAVLVVDPVGQGERIQFLDDQGKPATRGATTEHTLLNAGCNLVGNSVAALEWWDNHRAVDYLESRSDIDKTRMGVFGSSGGGTQTAYLIGLEDRFKVASVCSFFSKRERVLELSGPSDGCQHIPGEGANMLEIADWITMFAPKPVLIMSGLYDFVDYQGVLEGYDELQKVYTILRAKNNISLLTVESGHGMPRAKREALATWFRTWLCLDTTSVHETEMVTVPVTDLQCTETGQVNTAFQDAFTIPDYNIALANQFATGRSEFLKQKEAVIRQKVVELLGITIPVEKIRIEQTGQVPQRNCTYYKYQVIRKGEMPVPCVVVMPEKIAASSKVVLCLNDNGKDALLNDETTVGNFVNQGDIMVVADLRGFGETADPISLNDSKYWNFEYRNAMIGMHIGKPIMGQRVIDVMSLLDFFGTDEKLKGHPVNILANGLYGPTAIHAAYLDRRIERVEISRSVKSFGEYLKNPLQRDVYSNVLYGVLKYYDLKDLIGLSGKNRIQFVD